MNTSQQISLKRLEKSSLEYQDLCACVGVSVRVCGRVGVCVCAGVCMCEHKLYACLHVCVYIYSGVSSIFLPFSLYQFIFLQESLLFYISSRRIDTRAETPPCHLSPETQADHISKPLRRAFCTGFLVRIPRYATCSALSPYLQ